MGHDVWAEHPTLGGAATTLAETVQQEPSSAAAATAATYISTSVDSEDNHALTADKFLSHCKTLESHAPTVKEIAGKLQKAREIVRDFPEAIKRVGQEKNWAIISQGRLMDLETVEHKPVQCRNGDAGPKFPHARV